MKIKSLKAHSRSEWVPPTQDHEYPGDTNVQLGCLQRIADSLEKMEQPFAKLIEERDRYERWYRSELTAKENLYRRISALQGVITKLKKKSHG